MERLAEYLAKELGCWGLINSDGIFYCPFDCLSKEIKARLEKLNKKDLLAMLNVRGCQCTKSTRL